MVRNVDYETRRRLVLESAINKYIRDAVPVASEDIAEEFDLSSATIRNVFAELEKRGFLTHPYTSGGRMPTDKGYRYYVDFFISQMELLDDEKEHIVREFKREIKRLDDALEETSEFISAVTHYAGIVSFLKLQDKLFYKGLSRMLEQPEFKDSQKVRFLIRTIEDKRRLLNVFNRDFQEKVKVYIGTELGCPEMESCALVVSSFRVRNKPSGKVGVLGPMRMEYKSIIPTVEYVSDLVTEIFEGF